MYQQQNLACDIAMQSKGDNSQLAHSAPHLKSWADDIRRMPAEEIGRLLVKGGGGVGPAPAGEAVMHACNLRGLFLTNVCRTKQNHETTEEVSWSPNYAFQSPL